MSDLATRIERNGLTPELCEEVALALGWEGNITTGFLGRDEKFLMWWRRVGAGEWQIGQPDYANSLDAVRAEMPEGWRIINLAQASHSDRDPFNSIALRKGARTVIGNAGTLEAAWLVAILRAVEIEASMTATMDATS